MSAGGNITIPAWIDALGWIVPGKAFDAIRGRYRKNIYAKRAAEYQKICGVDEFGVPTYPRTKR